MTLYTDYEKDFTKPYTVILGYKVSKVDALPEGAIAKTISASKYAVIHVQAENLVREIANTWQKIGESDIPLSYQANFEVFKLEIDNKVDLFVAVSNYHE